MQKEGSQKKITLAEAYKIVHAFNGITAHKYEDGYLYTIGNDKWIMQTGEKGAENFVRVFIKELNKYGTNYIIED